MAVSRPRIALELQAELDKRKLTLHRVTCEVIVDIVDRLLRSDLATINDPPLDLPEERADKAIYEEYSHYEDLRDEPDEY